MKHKRNYGTATFHESCVVLTQTHNPWPRSICIWHRQNANDMFVLAPFSFRPHVRREGFVEGFALCTLVFATAAIILGCFYRLLGKRSWAFPFVAIKK